MTKDLTIGNPFRVMLNFMIPIFLGQLLQQAYSMVDTMVVGHFVGGNAIGGIGTATSLCMIVFGACLGLCTGFCIPLSNAFGAKNSSLLRQYLAHSIYLSAINTTIIMTVFLTFSAPILRAMGTPDENFGYAMDYLSVYFLGLPFLVLYNLTAGIIRAMGDSKTPLYFLLISSACNIVLDLLFVAGFGWAVTGAAVATSISQGLSGILCLIYMIKKFPIIHLRRSEMRWNRKHALHMLSNGLPLALQYCITAVGTMAMQVAINSLGAIYVNAVALTNKINQMLNTTFNSIGPTVSTFIGQNTGAKKPDRIRSGIWNGLIFSGAFAALYLILALFFTPQLVGLFLSSTEENLELLIRYINQYLSVIGYFSIFIGVVITFRFAMQGMGYSKFAMFSGVMELCARLIAAFVLVPVIGYWGVCFGAPMAWIFASSFVVPGAFICLGKLRKRFAAEDSRRLPS